MKFNPIQIIEALWIALGALWLVAGGNRLSQSTVAMVIYVSAVTIAVYLLCTSRFTVPLLAQRDVAAPPWVDDAGVGLAFAGALLVVWGRRIWKEDQLVRSGPCRFVRYPVYSGILVALIGTIIVTGQWRGIVAFGGVFILCWWKSQKQDALLLARFGQEFESYRRDVKALIPFVL